MTFDVVLINYSCNGSALVARIVTGALGVVGALAQGALQSQLEVGPPGLELGQPQHIILH